MVRVLVGVVGLFVVVTIIDAAVRTFVLPRGNAVRLTRVIAMTIRRLFRLVARGAGDERGRDRVLALLGPVTLIGLPLVWLLGLMVGFAGLHYAASGMGLAESLRVSGSSLFTLGVYAPESGAQVALVFAEAAVGVLFSALLISYLPTMYSAFSKRELRVTQLAVRADTPPSPVNLLIRAHRASFLDRLDGFFNEWEEWFVELEETHTSLAFLAFFRSPNPERSWLTAAGTVLDAAAFRQAVLDLPFSPDAGLCLRSGYLALRSIATFFALPFDPDPAPDAPIAVSEEDFLAAYEVLAKEGVPVREDRAQAWRDWSGWRVNYDAALVGLAGVVEAPRAPWLSPTVR